MIGAIKRKIQGPLAASGLYACGDIIVLAVGGFLLLPLYTRTLSAVEFGEYVAIKANIDLFNIVLHVGLVSAITRVYFDYRKRDEHFDYLSSVILFYVAIQILTFVGISLWAGSLWGLLSPNVPVDPYIWLTLAVSWMAFFAGMGATWLRLDGQPGIFAALQFFSAALLATTSFVALFMFKLGLPGLLVSLIAGSLVTASVLPWKFSFGFRFKISWQHIRSTLIYSFPILVDLISYFILNRVCILILQRYISVEELGVFGLAQQLSLIVGVVSISLGKAFQPLVFGSERGESIRYLDQFATIMIGAMLGFVGVFIVYSTEIVMLIAPEHYQTDLIIMRMMIFANAIYSVSIVSSTGLLFCRRPYISAAISVFSGLFSTALYFLVVPTYGTIGAALSMVCSFLVLSTLSYHSMTRMLPVRYGWKLVLAGLALIIVAYSAICIDELALGKIYSFWVKAFIVLVLWAILFLFNMATANSRKQ